MMNVNGKMIAVLGFVIILLTYLADLFSALFQFNLNINQIYAVGLLIAAIGFGIQWLSNKEFIDLLSAGTLGIAALRMLLITYFRNDLVGWLSTVGSSLYLFVMAVRAIQINKTSLNKFISFACICAGIYYIFSPHIVIGWAYSLIGYQNWLIVIWLTGYVVSTCVCILECLQEY